MPLNMLWELVGRLADTVLAIRISGETGSGKEDVARLFFGLYPQSQARFLKFNCKLLQMQLEGPPATDDPGASSPEAFSRALAAPQHHVFYLEHIDCLPGALQDCLLRLFESRYCPTPPWVIASSEAPLERCVQQAGFSPSLYNALDAIHVNLAPSNPKTRLKEPAQPIENEVGQRTSGRINGTESYPGLPSVRVNIHKERILEGLMTAADPGRIGLLDLAIISESVSQLADRIAAQPYGHAEIFRNRKTP